MSLYAYYWPDNTVSLVNVDAKSNIEAVLDEIGGDIHGIDQKRLFPVKPGMIITLKRDEEGAFELTEDFNEEFEKSIQYEQAQKSIADSKKMDDELHKIAKD